MKAMSDGVSRSSGHVAELPRAQGRLRLTFASRNGRTSISALEQSGCLRARLPRPERGAFAGAVMLNTAGGIASGDRLTTEVEWGAGARATVSAAAAERAYRARIVDRPARVETMLTVGEGASAEWLPQELILFDGARLERSMQVSLAGDATVLLVEALVFGRTARGEMITSGSLHDAIEIRRDNVLVHADRTRLEGDIAGLLARPAVADGGAAIALILWAGQAPEDARDRLRAALRHAACGDAGVSLKDGLVLARLVARDGAVLRRLVVAALGALRQDRPLPRVWLC